MKATDWQPFDSGQSIGQKGSEDGTILRDEEHIYGARITIERLGHIRRRFSITCGIYGWMLHTRFFFSRIETQKAFEEMKDELAGILNLIPSVEEADDIKVEAVSKAISEFVERFP
jgi:hypothetical protein